MSESVPRALAGRYEVGELIGRGGMAEVHIGRDTRLGRTVAIKVLRSDLARDPTFQARFRREAQSAAGLNHPAIVAVYDTGEDTSVDANGVETHVPFIVMEYVEGHTVRDLLRDGAALPIDEAVEITVGVLSALEYSHRAGIVHRDIKPANVMLTPTGDVKVMDFGIARAMADASGGMTQTQAVVGTAQYLSPEQARGEIVDTRSDLYSTGCLLFELLTGRPPFVGDSAVSVAYQHVSEEPPLASTLAPDVPEALDRIVMKALTKDKEKRYATAAEFRSDLVAAAGHGVISAPPLTAATTVLGATGAAGAASATAATTVFGAPANATNALPNTPRSATAPAAAEEDKPRGSALTWVLVAVGIIALVGIIWLLLLRGDSTPQDQPTTPTPTPTADMVEIPSMTGMDEAEVSAALAAVNLTPDFQEPEASDTIETGLFVRSDPASGQSVDVSQEANRTVQVWLSAGPDAITVPDVAGMTQAAARDALIDAGFDAANITTTTSNIPERPADEADSTDPAAGTDVAPDTPIVISLASGNVELPDLSGMALEDAVATLGELGLTYSQNNVNSNDFDINTVISSEPGAGEVAYDTRVTITVSAGPSPEPTPTPTTDPGNGNGNGNGGGESPPVEPPSSTSASGVGLIGCDPTDLICLGEG